MQRPSYPSNLAQPPVYRRPLPWRFADWAAI